MDHRVEQTRVHILNCADTLLATAGTEGVTFLSVANVARVTKQTIHRHWTTREQLVAELLTRCHDHPLQIETTPEAHLRAFLLNGRDTASSPTIVSAAALLMSNATTDPRSADILRALLVERMDSLRAGWGPVSDDDFAMIFGPVVFQILVMHKSVTDEFISTILDEAMARRSVVALTSKQTCTQVG